VRKILAVLGLALALASPALAQATQGSFGLDAMVAPTTGLGFAYYVTDGLSLRPWVGLGYSDYTGVYANVGAQLRWEIAADSRWSPYVSASALYSHNGAVSVTTTSPTGAAGRPTGSVPAVLRSNARASRRRRWPGRTREPGALRRRLGMYTTYPMGTGGTGWSTAIDDNPARAMVGLTTSSSSQEPGRRGPPGLPAGFPRGSPARQIRLVGRQREPLEAHAGRCPSQTPLPSVIGRTSPRAIGG
jgi:hypothetical protein